MLQLFGKHSLQNTDLSLLTEKINSHFSLEENSCLLTDNSNSGKFDLLVSIGVSEEIKSDNKNSFEQLKNFYEQKKDWLFGYFSYDLKNEIENLSSENFDGIKFPQLHFFSPKYLLIVKNNSLEFYSHSKNLSKECERFLAELNSNFHFLPPTSHHSPLNIKSRITKNEYLQTINKIKQHIKQGDIYEMNFCQEFYAENAEINPFFIYQQLNEISPMPFSCYYKLKDKYLACASPERFLKKQGNKIISQPIKGTIKRGSTIEEDNLLKNQLLNSEKERSENVMIVDLVRNDLSRTAKEGSVRVDELFGIYSFKQVHQMISTISSELNEGVHFTEVIKQCFPMGSMTGAPKVKAMELIEKYENTKRGLFSGAVGYITPDGDFDFNVVIRSILYNEKEKYLSFMVGSAITDKSIPAKEYEECLLKAKAMFEVLNSK